MTLKEALWCNYEKTFLEAQKLVTFLCLVFYSDEAHHDDWFKRLKPLAIELFYRFEIEDLSDSKL